VLSARCVVPLLFLVDAALPALGTVAATALQKQLRGSFRRTLISRMTQLENETRTQKLFIKHSILPFFRSILLLRNRKVILLICENEMIFE
jgi:hypothetical protein